MKKLVILLVTISMFVLVTGIVSAEGSLSIWNAASPEEGQALIAAFNKHHPDIRVDVIRAGSGELLTRLMAEQPRPSGDVIVGIAKEAFDGHYEFFTPYKTANDSDIPDGLKDKADQPKYYGYSMPLQAFMVNTDLLDPEDYPRTWKDLALDKYKGDVVMANPALSGSAYSQTFQMHELYGFEFLEELIPNVIFTTSSTMVPQAVARGEYAIGVTGEPNIAQHISDGSPVVAVYPEDGTGARFDASGIIKNASNLENAKIFMDFMTTKEAYQIIMETRARRTVHPGVAAPGALPGLDEIILVDYDAIKAAEMRDELTMRVSDLIR